MVPILNFIQFEKWIYHLGKRYGDKVISKLRARSTGKNSQPSLDFKGLTLIELLVIIAVLAIVAAIAIPVVTNVVSSSNQKALAQTQEDVNAFVEKYNNSGAYTYSDGVFTGYIDLDGNGSVSADEKIEELAVDTNKFSISASDSAAPDSIAAASYGSSVGTTFTLSLTAAAAASTFYLASNGVTVMCPGVAVGESFELGGNTYTKQDDSTLNASNAATACTTGVTNLYRKFYYTSFNENISHWDTSSVTNMAEMFRRATSFNQPIGAWDTSNVTSMYYMFQDAWNFNSDISGWDTSSVTDMTNMFTYADKFDQPIGAWDTSNVTAMNNMFRGSAAGNKKFSQNLSTWCVSQFASEPYGFATNAPRLTAKPVWGTCPAP